MEGWEEEIRNKKISWRTADYIVAPSNAGPVKSPWPMN
jgi:hypothetical protein